MMRGLMLLSPFLLPLVLGVLVVLVPVYASADCCGCGYCYMSPRTGCLCNDGSDPACEWCPNPYAPDNAVSDIKGAREPLPSPVLKSDLTERLIVLTGGGNRVLETFSVKLLRKSDGLKFACPGRDEKNMGNTLIRFVRAYIQGEPK